MKLKLLLPLLAILLLGTGCGSISNTSDVATSDVATAAGINDEPAMVTVDGLSIEYENAIPVPMQLALGTFELENTDYPIDAEQAEELLPLWKALNALSNDDTVAQAEVDALYQQIAEAMTPEQIAAIASMQLTFEDMRTLAQEQGWEFAAGGRFMGNDQISPQIRETAQAMRQSGQMPTGRFGPGGEGLGGGPPGGDGVVPPSGESTTTFQRVGNGLNSEIIAAVIQYLQDIAGE